MRHFGLSPAFDRRHLEKLRPVFPPLCVSDARAPRCRGMEARSVRRSAHRSVPVAVADGRGSTTMAAVHINGPSMRARFSRFGRMSMALLMAAALAVTTFGYVASTSQSTSVKLGADKWWLRMRAQEPLAGKGSPPAAPTTVTINGDVLLGQTSPVSFTCVDLDWWPETKCDYGRCTWGRSSMLTIDLDDSRLRAALRALSPSFLRLGGSLSDFVRYEVSDPGAADPAGCNASFGGPTLATRLGFPVGAGCLAAPRWDALHELCRDTGCSVVFTLNALAGIYTYTHTPAAPLHLRLYPATSACNAVAPAPLHLLRCMATPTVAGRQLQEPCAEGTDCLQHSMVTSAVWQGSAPARPVCLRGARLPALGVQPLPRAFSN